MDKSIDDLETTYYEPKKFDFTEPFTMSSGIALENIQMVYQTYGTLNESKSNAILICHALNGNHNVTGKTHEDGDNGWWHQLVGPNKAIDTNHFYVVCPNNIGGCHGTTGPTTHNEKTNQFWGADFPHIRIRDWVNSQYELQKHLEIDCWLAVVGGSLGGMQAMRWAVDYPNKLKKCVVLASTMYLDAQNIAFNEIARKAILTDPAFHKGDYLNNQTRPLKGLAVARMMANMSYTSAEKFNRKFGRLMQTDRDDFVNEQDILQEIESYVSYKAEKFASSFDANSYILITKMLDLFDIRRGHNHDAVAAFKAATCQFLVVSFSSDWRFSPERSIELVDSLIRANKQVSYCNIQSTFGHDSFLIHDPNYAGLLASFLQN